MTANPNNQPWDFATARQRCAAASRAQEQAEENYRATSREYAETEESYRVALAVEMLRLHDQDSVAWTAAEALARGEKNVAAKRRARDIAKGVMEAMEQALWRHTANRKDAQRFADWSQRRELAEGGA